jgi:nickel-type superoxide dismutase maturation protease
MQKPFSTREVMIRKGIRPWVATAALLGAVIVTVLRTRRLIVNGNSMLPGLFPGDRVLVIPARRIRPGDVVALRPPETLDSANRLLIKRVAAVGEPKGTVTVMGDNRSASTDSRDFGPVPRRAVMGRAVYRYAPPGREGRVRRILPLDACRGSVADTIDSDG